MVYISETSSGSPTITYTTTIHLSEYSGGSAIVGDATITHGLYKTSDTGITASSTITSVLTPTNSLVQHGLAIGDRVQFVPATSGGANGNNPRVASPLADYTTYYVVSVPSAYTFTVSATQG